MRLILGRLSCYPECFQIELFGIGEERRGIKGLRPCATKSNGEERVRWIIKAARRHEPPRTTRRILTFVRILLTKWASSPASREKPEGD